MSQSQPKAASGGGPDSKPLSQALGFMRLLWALTHQLESASKHMHSRLGVTGPQRLVLRLVGHHGRISAGELAEMLHIHPSSLTGVLRRLEQAELLRRESDPFDRRRALLELTRRGMRLNEQRFGTIEAAVARGLSKMSKERIASAKSVLRAITAAIEESNASAE